MVRAVYIADWDHWDESPEPGSFSLGEPDDKGGRDFWYNCPCGCGTQSVLRVGDKFKPAAQPSWNWNGSVESPTLTPSVHHVGHWHGWLTAGEWKVC